MRRIPMTMQDWEVRLGGFLKLWNREVLQDAGKVTAETKFEKYRIIQDRLLQSDFGRLIGQTEAMRKPTSDDSGM